MVAVLPPPTPPLLQPAHSTATPIHDSFVMIRPLFYGYPRRGSTSKAIDVPSRRSEREATHGMVARVADPQAAVGREGGGARRVEAGGGAAAIGERAGAA